MKTKWILIGSMVLALSACSEGEVKPEDVQKEASSTSDGKMAEPGSTDIAEATKPAKEEGHKAKLKGQIFNEANNKPIADVKIGLFLGETKVTEIESDSEGKFLIETPLKPGRYLLKTESKNVFGVLSFSLKTQDLDGLKIFAKVK